MKMSNDGWLRLVRAMDAVIDPLQEEPVYKDMLRDGFISNRLGWGWFNIADKATGNQLAMSFYREGLNDDNIRAGLNKYFKVRGLTLLGKGVNL